jgi:hypothetical protein
MEGDGFTEAVRRDESRWTGWVAEVHEANAQEHTRVETPAALKVAQRGAAALPAG